ARRLHDEHVSATDVLVDLKRDFRIRESLQPRLSESDAEKLANLGRQPAVRAAGKQFQLPATHRLGVRIALGAGWGGRIRTSEYGIQSPAPYRLATPHRLDVHGTSSLPGGLLSGHLRG